MAQIYELEKLNEVYDKDIEQLEAKLKLLKNEQIVQQNDEKTLSTIQSNLIQENENQLINEEQKLIEEEKILKDKLLNVNLIYKKIMENIDYFIKEMKSDDEKQKGEKTIKKKYNFDDTNDNFFQKATMAGQSTVYDPNSTKNDFNNTKTTMNKQNIISPLNTTRNYFLTNESKIKSKTQNKFYSRGSTPKTKIFDDICLMPENLPKKEDSMKPNSEKEKINDNNNILPGFNEQEDSLFDDMSNSNIIVKNYSEFLIWLNHKFDKFFLCFNKEQFKATMSEKAQRENEQLINEQKNKNMERTNERKATKRRRTRKFDGFGLTNRMHIDAGKEEAAKYLVKQINEFMSENQKLLSDNFKLNIQVNELQAQLKENKKEKKESEKKNDELENKVEELESLIQTLSKTQINQNSQIETTEIKLRE